MKQIATLIPAVLFLWVLQGSGQQRGHLSGAQAPAAAERAFTAGNWNPGIFEALPDLRVTTLSGMFPEASRDEVQKELQEKFGNGPFTMVSYHRRPETRSTNGGEVYCRLFFLVYSPLKVAVIDSRAVERPADKLPKKSP